MPPQNSPPGIFSAVIGPIGDAIAQHLNLPPRERAISRGATGAALLVIAVYGVLFAEDLTGNSASGLMTAFLRAPSQAPTEVWLPLAFWAGSVLLACVWLISAVRGSGGVDGIAAFWAAVRLAIWVGLIWWTADAPADWRDWVAWLDRVLIIFIAADLTRFCLQLGGGSALRMVNRQIRQTRIVLRPATGRRHWWQFWK